MVVNQISYNISEIMIYYHYYSADYSTLESRVSYQKHKLCDKLDIFDPKLTEWDNMRANGYDRVWDCGTDVWLWNP